METQPSAVNKVRQDGNIKIPPELANQYEGEYMAIFDDGMGEITLKVVDRDG